MLEHPDEAFAAYAAVGVHDLVCEEKHMGSRAVVLVCRDDVVAAERFGATDGETGAAYTRTGRSFFDRSTTERLLAGIRDVVGTTGLCTCRRPPPRAWRPLWPEACTWRPADQDDCACHERGGLHGGVPTLLLAHRGARRRCRRATPGARDTG